MVLWLNLLPFLLLLLLLLAASSTTSTVGKTTKQPTNNSWWEGHRGGRGGRICDRNSPHQLYYSEIQPRLVAILDEASSYTVTLLTKLEDDLEKFENSNFSASPIQDVGGRNHLTKVRNYVLGHLHHVFELLDEAWAALLRANEEILEEGCGTVSDLRQTALRVKEATSAAESLLQMVLRDLNATVRAIVYNGLYLLRDATSRTQEGEGEEEEEVAAHIVDQLPEVAPGLLGLLMTKVLKTGGNLKDVAKTPTAFLLTLQRPLLQVMDDLALLPESPLPHLEHLWEQVVLQSDVRLKEDPISREDFEAIYDNDIYLSEVTLSLLATW